MRNDLTDFEDIIDAKYGAPGEPDRDLFELEAKAFIVQALLEEELESKNISEAQLAAKSGVDREEVAKLRGGNLNVNVSTLVRLFEVGMGRRVNISFS